jgi:phosphonopyruvate decarboxylase
MNSTLAGLEVYASKAIGQRAREDPDIINLSFGEPEFGPPDHLLCDIAREDLTLESFVRSLKRYEESLGSPALRRVICAWYKRRYGMEIDVDTEIIITHGGVEAITLAILAVTEVGERVAVTDPSYMLYQRALIAAGRLPWALRRTAASYEYSAVLLRQLAEGGAKALIVNSPENPSGYVIDRREWQLLQEHTEKTGLWIIHDEVYDTMDFGRVHSPFRSLDPGGRSIQINSCSKKFGVPGLRTGWMIADKAVIALASKIHDYMYLGVNIHSEQVAVRLLADERGDRWSSQISRQLSDRAARAMAALDEANGFSWPRKPLGAMFLFPNVSGVYDRMPSRYKSAHLPVGDAVANYLIDERKVAVVPGSVYGREGDEHVRIVLCGSDEKLDIALERMTARPVGGLKEAPAAKVRG